MSRSYRLTALMVILGTIATSAFGQSDSNRIWFTWEHRTANPDLCREKNLCHPVSRYITRLVELPRTERARAMVGAIDSLATKRGQPVEHPETPLICQNVNTSSVLGFNPESWELSDKKAALKDLPGIHFSVRKLKAPVDYEGPFGDQLQALMEKKFWKSGIRVLTKDQMERAPGQPELNIYFSNTNPDTGCWFSVFASMSQTVLLTRNHTVKLRAGTWGSSGGYSSDHPHRSEMDAILEVVDKFIADYWAANSGKTQNVSVKN
ncbi:MAG: hypothetical protein GY952_13825 [Rhodobacteraceae bacterium]|nr:hypothetical protein [Paracoccaceae bacterium]